MSNQTGEKQEKAGREAKNQKESAAWVLLELLEREGSILRLDGSIPPDMAADSFALKLNGETLPVYF